MQYTTPLSMRFGQLSHQNNDMLSQQLLKEFQENLNTVNLHEAMIISHQSNDCSLWPTFTYSMMSTQTHTHTHTQLTHLTC